MAHRSPAKLSKLDVSLDHPLCTAGLEAERIIVLNGSDVANEKRRKGMKRSKRRKVNKCNYKCEHKLVSD